MHPIIRVFVFGVVCSTQLQSQTLLPNPVNNPPADNSYGAELDAPLSPGTTRVLYFVHQNAAGGHTFIYYSFQSGGALGTYSQPMIVPDVNDGTDHDAPAVLPDNQGMIITRSGGLFRLYLTIANNSASAPQDGWSAPQPLTIGGGTDFGATLLREPGRRDRAHLFFTSTRQGPHDVYFAEHNGVSGYAPNSWISPVKLDILPRTPGAGIVFEPAVALLSDGRVEMVYAASGASGMRLWRTTNPSSDPASLRNPSAWSTPEQLTSIPAVSSTRSPFIDADSRRLYYEDTTNGNRLLWVTDFPEPPSPDTAPTADAGVDFSVNEGQVGVTLDGSESVDADNDPITFSWVQVLGGTPVSLFGADTVNPTFDAPLVAIGGETLSFELTVTANGKTASDTVSVSVVNVNHPPVADAGSDQSVAEGAPVTLHGEDSYDDDGDSFGYTWVQVGGSPTVSLSGADTANPTFDAPVMTAGGAPGIVATLVFELTVDDGYPQDVPASGYGTFDHVRDTVVIEVTNVNNDPVAAAGSDQTADENRPVSLSGAQSADPDGDALAYTWQQVGGPLVAGLTGETTATPSFMAPFVNTGGEDVTFELTVDDGYGGSATDTVVVHVQNANDPPDASTASPTVDCLWPPNHRLVSVGIMGVTDPDSNATITINSVTQDEPTNGTGDGDTPIDAIINADGTVLLRAERAGGGDGRVYHIHFTASDPEGSASGVVTVCVPKKKKVPAIDGGQLHDSTN